VGLLTGGIAHDFNNILGAIVGSMELAIDKVPENAAVASVLEEGIAAAMFGSNLTRRLLAFARQQTLEPSHFDLNEVVRGLANMLERTLGGQVTVKVELEPGLWLAHADPSQIGDALLNLSINARDAMPEGGEVRIETGNITLDAFGEAKALDVAPGDYVILAVTDTGTGMSEEVIARACEPFFTTKDASKGSGLGLSMIYGFARQSGGNVKIESVCGSGTTVRLYLPRASVAVHHPPKLAASTPERFKVGETILVVDDFASMRTLSCRLLTSMGYRVLEAENAHQALAILDTGVAIDLLFTDIVMPGGLSGRALADEMRKRGRMLPVLFTSGYARSDFDVDDAIVTNLLSKPYSKQELATRVRETLDAG
jgi:CheY-like chemotaxis protein